MTVYQHVVEYNSNDGIGNDITGISEYLDTLEINNKIITLKNNFSFTEHKVIELSLSQNSFKNNDIHILHYGISGYPIQIFSNLPGKKILRFHNITPYNFFMNFAVKNFIIIQRIVITFRISSFNLFAWMFHKFGTIHCITNKPLEKWLIVILKILKNK